MKFEQLVIIVVSGVILADLVAHVAGTNALFNGIRILWDIGTQPTNTSLLSTPTANHIPTSPTQKA